MISSRVTSYQHHAGGAEDGTSYLSYYRAQNVILSPGHRTDVDAAVDDVKYAHVVNCASVAVARSGLAASGNANEGIDVAAVVTDVNASLGLAQRSSCPSSLRILWPIFEQKYHPFYNISQEAKELLP